MGGHRAGEVASADTVEVLERSGRPGVPWTTWCGGAHRQPATSPSGRPTTERCGAWAPRCASSAWSTRTASTWRCSTSATAASTCIAVGELRQLTEDHSLVETLVREGRITAEEAAGPPAAQRADPCARGRAPRRGRCLVAAARARAIDCCSAATGCSTSSTSRGSPRCSPRVTTPEVAARRLAAEADAAGGRDNITAVVVDVVGAEDPPEPARPAVPPHHHADGRPGRCLPRPRQRHGDRAPRADPRRSGRDR